MNLHFLAGPHRRAARRRVGRAAARPLTRPGWVLSQDAATCALPSCAAAGRLLDWPAAQPSSLSPEAGWAIVPRRRVWSSGACAAVAPALELRGLKVLSQPLEARTLATRHDDGGHTQAPAIKAAPHRPASGNRIREIGVTREQARSVDCDRFARAWLAAPAGRVMSCAGSRRVPVLATSAAVVVRQAARRLP